MESFWRKFEQTVRGNSSEEEAFVRRNFARLRLLGIYRGASKASIVHRMGFYAMDLFFLLQIGTIVWDLGTVLDDIGRFGDGLCILAGLLLVLVKKWHSVVNIVELDECVAQLQAYHSQYLHRGDAFVWRMRQQELQERLLLMAAKLFAGGLGGCLIGNALVSNGERPIFRASYPFSTEPTVGYVCVFLCQVLLVAYVLVSVVYIDHFGAQVMSQMSLLFCLQRMEFERIGSDRQLPVEGPLHGDESLRKEIHRLIRGHQELLIFCTRLKRLYEPNLMAQFVSSMLIICLTAFELMFAKGDPMLVMRFGTYMATAFYQIFVWSFFGNQVTYMSTSIHEATIRCNWMVLDAGLKKDLQFTMMRSQKPFIIDVYWLFPLTYETFIAILSRSYSIFTLLCTMIE